jgi:hypothetical protein
MEYNGMSWGMVNQDGKHCSCFMMQSMSKLKEEEKIVMSEASTVMDRLQTSGEL